MSDQQTPQQGPFNPQGPQAYPSAPMPPGGTPQPPKPGKLGLVALILAAVGLIFSVIEGAYIIGWVVLPVAFILAIVALIQKNQSKKLAAGALAIAVVGFIAAPIAFLSSVGKAFDEAFSGGEVTASAPKDAGEGDKASNQGGEKTDDADQAAATDAKTDADGTRENPYPIGTTISNNDWEVTVNSFKADATSKVLKANEFNDKPKDGHTYALTNLTLTYLGDDKDMAASVTVSFVTDKGNVINSFDTFVVAPDQFGLDELYNGASVTGNQALEIPKGETGLLRVSPGMFAKEVFFATS